MTFFNEFGKKWASEGSVEPISETQKKSGWDFLGSVPPISGQFNLVQQNTDEKINYLFNLINSFVISRGGTLNAVSTNALRDILNNLLMAVQGGHVGYATKDGMLLDTTQEERTIAEVLSDPVAENNGFYLWLSGEWVKQIGPWGLAMAATDASRIAAEEAAADADAAKTEAQTAAGLAVDAQADIHTNWQGKLDIAAQQAGIATDKATEASASAQAAADSAIISEQKAGEAIDAVSSTKQYVDSALSDLSTAANKFYPTLAEANADIANITINQPVTVGEAVNGGLWYKTTVGATSLTKSAYDPLVQGKAYTADYVAKTGFAKIAGAAQTNINYDTATRTLTFSNNVHITTGTIRQQLTTPQSVVLDKNTIYRLDFNVDTGLIRVYWYTQNYQEGWIPFGLVRAYVDKIETSDFQYAINGVAFDAIKIATDASALDATNKVKVLEDKIVSQSSNLYDASAATVGKVILTDGSIVDNAQHSITDFIAVLPSQQYTIKAASSGTPVQGFNWISYYDANKNFISRVAFSNTGAGSVGGALTITMPSNAYYIRLNMQDVDPTLKNRQINLGAVALPYELYKPTSLKVKLSQENIDQVLAQTTDTAKPYIVQSSNLYDASAATIGYAILVDGTVSASSDYICTDFMPISPNTDFTVKANTRGFNFIAYYTQDKTFIRRDSFNNEGTGSINGAITLTMPSNAYFIRLNMQDTSPTTKSRQVNLGSVALPYEKFGEKLTGINLDKDILDQIGNSLDIKKTDSIIFDMPVDGTFSTEQIWDDYTSWRNGATRANDVYAMFDALQAAHPNYITKQVLGQDDYGYTISCYKFIPKRPSVDVVVKKAKIFITCGTHGYEHVPPLAMYLLLEQMCNNWQNDLLLEALRHNVDLLIIPVVNPSGFDDYTRKNRNGVDINRNFPAGWSFVEDPLSPYYGGAAPLDQKESQYVAQIFNENTDINVMYDFHNFHGSSAENRYIWIPNGGVYVQHMAQILNQRMTRKWRREFPWLPADESYFVGNSSSGPGAQIQSYARYMGIEFAATFEVCEKWWVGNGIVSTYDATHCKTAVESITNWLLINLNELKRI